MDTAHLSSWQPNTSGRSPGWKHGEDGVTLGIKRDGKQTQHSDKLGAKMLWSVWSKWVRNTFVKLSALFTSTATLAHHLPLCINAVSTFFIHCWMISVQSIFSATDLLKFTELLSRQLTATTIISSLLITEDTYHTKNNKSMRRIRRICVTENKAQLAFCF